VVERGVSLTSDRATNARLIVYAKTEEEIDELSKSSTDREIRDLSIVQDECRGDWNHGTRPGPKETK